MREWVKLSEMHAQLDRREHFLPANVNFQQLSFFAILAVTFGLLITERVRNDIVALLLILSLYVTGILKADEALSGFGSEPAIVVAAIFVLSGAIQQTGLSETIGGWIARLAGKSYVRVLAVIMPSVGLLSAFTHHLTTTAMMLPVTLNLAQEDNIPPSKLLMPLSFAASLGTTITIIGAPAFLIASGLLQQAGRPGLGIFSIAPIGLALTAAGTLFVLLVGQFLLPSRRGTEDTSNRFRLSEYFTELTVLPDSPFLDQTVEEVEANEQLHVRVIGWIRNRRRIMRPFGDRRMQAGDVLLIRAAPEEIVAIRQSPGVELQPVSQYGAGPATSEDGAEDISDFLVQAVVAPESDLAGRTLGEIDFRRRYGATVIALWRRRGWLQQELARIRLQPGDVLVLQGDKESLARVGADRAFLMMVPFHGEGRLRRKARLAGIIMLATVALAASGLVTIEMATLAGAVAMVLSGCITPRQAYRSIDVRIYVFIAGAIPVGSAMQKTHTSDMIAGWLKGVIGGWNELLVLALIFAIVSVLTQFMSDSATVAVFGPVALAVAQGLGRPPEPYLVTVAMAAVASFLTPIGHHGNLVVYGPGGYRFRDFVVVGTPLTIVVGLIVILLAPMLWRG